MINATDVTLAPAQGLRGAWNRIADRLDFLISHGLIALAARVSMALVVLSGCNRAEVGSPEAVADAFCEAYFREADQEKAKQFTAFGAT